MYFFRETKLKSITNLRSSLSYVKGIGLHRSDNVFSTIGFGKSTRVYHMNYYYYTMMSFLAKFRYMTGTGLIRSRQNNLRIFDDIKSVRASMHNMGLPAHGQRTRDNHRTKRRLKSKLI